MDLRAFLTGSRVYGTPHKDSDIDLVVFVTTEELALLLKMADPTPKWLTNTGSEPDRPFDEVGAPLRFGKLNLLCVTDERAYEVWRRGTFRLRKISRTDPVSRAYAVAFFRKMREDAGLIRRRGDNDQA